MWVPNAYVHCNVSDKYSNSDSRISIFEIIFLEPVQPRKHIEIQVFCVAIDSFKFSSESEPSLRFFGRLNFSVLFECLSLVMLKPIAVAVDVDVDVDVNINIDVNVDGDVDSDDVDFDVNVDVQANATSRSPLTSTSMSTSASMSTSTLMSMLTSLLQYRCQRSCRCPPEVQCVS